MTQKLILYPVLAMVALTFIVAIVMFRRRVASMKSQRIHPQKIASPTQVAALIDDSRASDNLKNLFETPVLFYAAMVIIFAAGLTCKAQLIFAWGYVAARCVHSGIHCTSNIVMQRFYAFLTSGALLLAIWLMLAYQLFFVL